ncbi:hypothetical protein ABIA20_006570 [Sinorhizobium fredii]
MFVLLCKCQHCGEPMARYPNSEIRTVCTNPGCGLSTRAINFYCQFPSCDCNGAAAMEEARRQNLKESEAC